MPTPVEQPAPKHKRTLQGVQRPRPSKAATVAVPPKAAFGFPSRLAQAGAGTATTSGQTISLAKTIKQTVPAGTANIGESKLARPASVIGPTTKTSVAPTQAPSKLRPASVVPKGLRPPTRFRNGGNSAEAASTSAAGQLLKAGAASTRAFIPAVRLTSKVGSSIPVPEVGRMVDRRMYG
jgi:hypothetical protein